MLIQMPAHSCRILCVSETILMVYVERLFPKPRTAKWSVVPKPESFSKQLLDEKTKSKSSMLLRLDIAKQNPRDVNAIIAKKTSEPRSR
jgi:hypothetical protein